jgi:hypothetical protein
VGWYLGLIYYSPKFNGVAKHTFYLHLKETEFRFNHRRDNLYIALLRLLRVNLLNFLRPLKIINKTAAQTAGVFCTRNNGTFRGGYIEHSTQYGDVVLPKDTTDD